MNDEHLELGLFNLDSEGAHGHDRVHAIDAPGKTAENADPVGERSDHHRTVRNALVARDIDFRLDPRRAFNSKINHGMKKARSPATREGEEKNPKLRANVQHDTRVRRRAQLRVFGRRRSISLGNEEDLIRIGITHFGSRRETTDIDVALIGSVRAGDEAGFVRHRNPVGNVPSGLLDRAGRRRNFRRG